VRDISAGDRGTHGVVHQLVGLRGVDQQLVVHRHIGIQANQVDLLLVAGPQHRSLLHPGDGQHRRMVQLGVVEAVEQVNPARPRGGQTDPQTTGRLSVSGGHERGGLFMLDQHETNTVLVTTQPLHDPVDAVTGQTEDRVDSPVRQPLHQRLSHDPPHNRRLTHNPAADTLLGESCGETTARSLSTPCQRPDPSAHPPRATNE
jgi:hypothetical protein